MAIADKHYIKHKIIDHFDEFIAGELNTATRPIIIEPVIYTYPFMETRHNLLGYDNPIYIITDIASLLPKHLSLSN